MIRIRAFRAIDDASSCNAYAQAHMDVLKVFGITRITTANNDWIRNPDVFVIMAESIENGIPLGGARIHLHNVDFTLPFVRAVEDFDPSVYDLVAKHSQYGTGEICGLWNAREVAGWGLGTLFLARAGVALAARLPMKSMFVLCGEHTIGVTLEKGFVIEKSLGDNGTFNYPKEGLVATAAVMNDVLDLRFATETDRTIIESLRRNPNQIRTETSSHGDFDVDYQLGLGQIVL